MNERIKRLRKILGLTQQEFADRIGMKRNTIANYETDRNSPSNSVITLICKTFNVSEEWLRDGMGEVFNPTPSAALDALARERSMTYSDYTIIEKFLNLNPQNRQIIAEFMMEVATALNSLEASLDRIVFSQQKSVEDLVSQYAQDSKLYKDLNDLENIQKLLLLQTIAEKSDEESKGNVEN